MGAPSNLMGTFEVMPGRQKCEEDLATCGAGDETGCPSSLAAVQSSEVAIPASGLGHPVCTHQIDFRILDDILNFPLAYDEPNDATPHAGDIHLILVNWQLLDGPRLLRLLRAADSITCADGGAAQLLERLKDFDLPTIQDVFRTKDGSANKPLLVCGDGDSLGIKHLDRPEDGFDFPDIRRLRKFGFEVKRVIDESTTDFEKCLIELRSRNMLKTGGTVVVDGGFGGRFDQSVSLIASGIRAVGRPQAHNGNSNGNDNDSKNRHNMIYVGANQYAAIVPTGKSVIKCPSRVDTELVSVMPFVPVGSVTLKGASVCLENRRLLIGEATVNEAKVIAETLEVITTDPFVVFLQVQEE